MNQTMSQVEPNFNHFAALIGLDWADDQHQVALWVPGTEHIELSTFQQEPEAIAQGVASLRQRFGERPLAICLEQSRGPLMHALMAYANLVLDPINPKTSAKLREALHPSGRSDDPVQARVLVMLLRQFGPQLVPWKPDDALTRQWAVLVQDRRSWGEQGTALTNQLRATLKAYFPQALELVSEDLSNRLTTDFLRRWPTLAAVQAAGLEAVRAFYSGHNSRRAELLEARLRLIAEAVPLTTDPAILEAYSLRAQCRAQMIATVRATIERYDREIARLFEGHPDAFIFASLPGAGPVLAPRLLVAFVTDRQRLPTPEAIACYSGTAPVTEQSGKQQWVHRRWTRPVFVHQSFVEFSGSSRRRSRWAQCCYEHLVAQGQGHWSALRVLGLKWQRVIWRCWQDRVPYDEARHVASLRAKGLSQSAALSGEPAGPGCEQPMNTLLTDNLRCLSPLRGVPHELRSPGSTKTRPNLSGWPSRAFWE